MSNKCLYIPFINEPWKLDPLLCVSIHLLVLCYFMPSCPPGEGYCLVLFNLWGEIKHIHDIYYKGLKKLLVSVLNVMASSRTRD